MEYTEYIKPELLLVIAVCYLVGMALKNATFKDKYIPLTLMLIGIVICGMYLFASIDGNLLMTLFMALTQGILTSGTAVFGNQLVRQLVKDE